MTISGPTPTQSAVSILTAPTMFLMFWAVMITVVVVAMPADAATSDARPCATRGEYRQVRRGMTQARVHAIFDSAGVPGEASRHYRACGGDRMVVIDYTFDAPKRVQAK